MASTNALADLELLIRAHAFSTNAPLSTETLLAEIETTPPLALTMTEKIGELRNWARERTVMADTA